jgi:hypothetical protein
MKDQPMRVAIYARYSTSLQLPSKIKYECAANTLRDRGGP